MPAMHAADLAALDALFRRRAIFIDDHLAGQEFAFLAARRTRTFYRPIYVAAGCARRSRTAEVKGRLGGIKSLGPSTVNRPWTLPHCAPIQISG